MTNPGHVDPGYKGPMSFTVINMGSEDYTLLKKDRIVTLLFFKLGKPATKDLAARGGVTSGVKSLLSVLSPDFLGISTRVKEAAESEEQKTRRIGLLAPTLAGIAAVLITLVTSIMPLQGDVSDLKATTAAMGEVRELEKKIAKLEGSLDREGLPLPLKDDGN